MRELFLPYGSRKMSWIPPACGAALLRCNEVQAPADPETVLKSSLSHPINSIPLRDRVKPADKIAIIISDSARLFPQGMIIKGVLQEISHVDPKGITFVIANGNHPLSDPSSVGLGDDIKARFRIINHNSLDKKAMKIVGKIPAKERFFFFVQAVKHLGRSLKRLPQVSSKLITRALRFDFRGIGALIGYTMIGRSLFIMGASFESAIMIRREVAEADLRILIGQIKPHFLAGFSGGYKAVFPGCAHRTAIAMNHFMMNHPTVELGQNDGNIIRAEIEQAAKFCGESFAVNVVMNGENRIAGIFSGDPVEAQRAGSILCARVGGVETCKADIVISAEGFPEAINLYQLTKIVPPAARVVREGGAIICAGECRDGIGGLTIVNDITCKIGFWDLVPRGVRMYLVCGLPREEVEKTEFIYASSIDEALEKEMRRQGKDAKITVLSGAGLLIPRGK